MKTKFTYGAVIALVVLLVFSYIAFMGLVYWQNGEISVPLLITLSFILIVASSITFMCMSRATRWKNIGQAGQIAFGFIVFCAFIASAFPFTNFMDVIGHQGQISNEIDSVMLAAQRLDNAYITYSEQRIADYRDKLQLISEGKEIQPTVYAQYLGGAAGNTDEEKIRRLTNSLKNRLLPDSMEVAQQERSQWLRESSEMSVWNIMLPKNIIKIQNEVTNWTQNYINLSTESYRGEDTRPFSYDDFSTRLEELSARYAVLHWPTWWSILVAIGCFFVMLLPYWLTEKDVAGYGSGKKYL